MFDRFVILPQYDIAVSQAVVSHWMIGFQVNNLLIGLYGWIHIFLRVVVVAQSIVSITIFRLLLDFLFEGYLLILGLITIFIKLIHKVNILHESAFSF